MAHRLVARRPTKVVAITLTDKIARIAWAMMARGEPNRTDVRLRHLADILVAPNDVSFRG